MKAQHSHQSLAVASPRSLQQSSLRDSNALGPDPGLYRFIGGEQFIPDDVLSLPRWEDFLEVVTKENHYFHCLPPKHSNAGVALRHCLSTIEKILKRQYPCVFKFGFTHCLGWRWNNSLYGYKTDRDKYQYIVAVYVSATSTPAALMEAFLIKEYKGPLECTTCLWKLLFCLDVFVSRSIIILPRHWHSKDSQVVATSVWEEIVWVKQVAVKLALSLLI